MVNGRYRHNPMLQDLPSVDIVSYQLETTLCVKPALELKLIVGDEHLREQLV